MDVMAEAVRERAELVELLESLGDEEWEAPTLCAEWSVRDVRPSGFTAALGGAVALTDTLIHQQDIRRPLGRPRDVPDDRVRFALGFACTAPVVRGFWNVRGARVGAPRVGWAAGRGPVAQGDPEAVLMVVAGRRGILDELSGPGVDRLRPRLG